VYAATALLWYIFTAAAWEAEADEDADEDPDAEANGSVTF